MIIICILALVYTTQMPPITSVRDGRQFFEMAFVRVDSKMNCCIDILIHSNEYYVYSSPIIHKLEAPNNKCS